MNLIFDQIKADIHNIQVMVDMLPLAESKGEYRSIQASIKQLVREVKEQKKLINEKIYHKEHKYDIPLFEVELPEPEIDYSTLTSFFGQI